MSKTGTCPQVQNNQVSGDGLHLESPKNMQTGPTGDGKPEADGKDQWEGCLGQKHPRKNCRYWSLLFCGLQWRLIRLTSSVGTLNVRIYKRFFWTGGSRRGVLPSLAWLV